MHDPRILSVNRSEGHGFSKPPVGEIELLAGLGVKGDAHAGRTVQHRSRVARDPTQPNLRQVHLLHQELLDRLAAQGFEIRPGAVGENVTTVGLDLLTLPRGARLAVGASAVVEITGLRNPCAQLERYRAGLLGAVLRRGSDGQLIRLAGVMGVVLVGGVVRAGDEIGVELPAGAALPLEVV